MKAREKSGATIKAHVAWMKEHAADEFGAARADLEERIEGETAKIKRLIDPVAEGTMTARDVKARMQELADGRAALEAQLAKLLEPQAVPTFEDVDPAKVRARLRGMWEHPELSVRRAALNDIIQEIRV